MKSWRRGSLAVAVTLVVLLAAGIAVGRARLLGAVATLGIRFAGYDFSYDAIRFGGGHIVVDRPDVRTFGGEPVFTAATLDVTYDVRRAFDPAALYGVRAVALERPKLTVIHHRDGSYNIRLPQSNSSAPAAPFVLPTLDVAVRDGSAGLIDDGRLFRHSRRLALEKLDVRGSFSPHGRSSFALSLALLEDGGAFPIVGRGTLDPARGFDAIRIRARTIGLAPLMDYALNSTALHVAGGVLNDVDARVYGLPDRTGALTHHVSVTANLDHFQPYLGALAKPLRDGRGSVRLFDDGLALPRVDGSIAAIPVRIAGGVYDLAHPTLRLGIAGHGDLARLLTLADGAKALAVRGPLAFRLLVQGDATAPQIVATFRSPRLTYGRIAIDAPSGLVALRGEEAAIVRSDLHYDGIALGARGRVLLRKHPDVEVVADIDAPAGRIPYATNLLGPMRLLGTAVASGVDRNIATAGFLGGDLPDRHLAATFGFDGRGVGGIGPVAFVGPGARALYARVDLDRPGFRGGAAFVSARRFAFSTAGPQPRLPGIPTAALPAVSGVLDADVAGAFDGHRSTVVGDAHLTRGRALGYPIDDLVARARATDGARVAVDARYRGALAPLGAAAGSRIALAGRVDIPISVVAAGPRSALVQIAGARFVGARVGGVALQGLSATVGIRGDAYDVYAARLQADGNDLIADGSFGNGGTLHVSTGGVDLASLRGLGLPVTRGRVTALADVSGTVRAPHVVGGIALGGLAVASYPGLGASANTHLTYDGDGLALAGALAQAGPVVATLDGGVHGLRGSPNAARYDLSARVRQADIATLARLAKTPLSAPEGTLDASVRVAGMGRNPAVAATVAIPEGSLNGLRFRDASVRIAGSPSDVRASDGRVTVRSSTIGFAGSVAASRRRIVLHAPRVDLADLNDYFDRGDTLGGVGAIDVALAMAPDAVVTSGRVRLAHTRFRRFDVGDTRADWSTAGRTILADVALGGEAGRVGGTGRFELAPTQPLRDAAHRTRVRLAARATAVDLGTWLPAAGLTVPLVGFADGSATVAGTYPALDVAAHAELTRAVARGIAIRTASADVRASRGRATITRAVVAVAGLDATASGTLGFAPRSPLDLTLTARAPDAGALARTLTGKTYDATAALVDTLHVTGTRLAPRIADTFDADALRYGRLTVPHAHADVTVAAGRATLSRGEVDLTKGRLLLTGFVPLTNAYALGPASAPLRLALVADRIDLGQFAALLPKGTVATGVFDGRVALAGTRADPGVSGTLTLADGAFSGPQERSRIDAVAAALTFDRRTATLHDASARVGGGTISADGRVSVADLRDPSTSAAATLRAVSRGAVFDFPGLFRGRIDGAVTVARAAGRDPVARGDVAITSARIATNALLPKTPATASTASPHTVGLDLGIDVGRDVRVQGGPVDIGAQGALRVGGTLASPTAAGTLTSTGGTLSFYRTFAIQYPSTVAFDPSNGVVPSVDATATTTVDNPQTDVTLHVTGPATALDVGLTSQPGYSREQILGLLVGAQALGAVSGVQTTAQSGPQTNPFQAAAQGQLGTLLTQNILEPFSSQLGGAVGLSNLAINYSPGGNVNIGAQKKLFKNVNAVFAQSFNYPPRQSLGLVASPNDATALQLTFFSQPGSNRFDTFEGARSLESSNASVTSVQPASGSSGFSFSLQRKFR